MLKWVLTVGAALCLAYYVVIILYAGVGTSYAFLWLCFAGFLLLTALCIHYGQKLPERPVWWLPISLVTITGSGVLILLILQIVMFARIPVTAEPDLDYVIVLGSQVREGKPGKILKRRLDKAAEYAAQNPNTILVLTGGSTEGQLFSEAKVMETYLLEQGVPKLQLALEEDSVNTAQNVANSLELIGDYPAKIGFLTSNFHLYRAKRIAQKQGIETFYGIAAESDEVLFLHFCIREGLAFLKDRMVGNL